MNASINIQSVSTVMEHSGVTFCYLQGDAVEFLHSNPTAAPFHTEPLLPGNQMSDVSDVRFSKENWMCKALFRTSPFLFH